MAERFDRIFYSLDFLDDGALGQEILLLPFLEPFKKII
jgi:hypothetical protein